MQNLEAQVTGSLVAFPDVTQKALKEDEINLDSVLRGKFSTGRTSLAWLACGPQLEITNSVTGERISAYHFSGLTERPPVVVAVKEFTWQKKTGLLVGLVEAEGSVLCLYDIGISKVVKAVVLPGSVTAVEPIINHGGASASTQHLHQSLRWFFGVTAVVTDVGHVLLIDLCLDEVSSNQDELDASDLEVMSVIPTKIPKLREAATRERRHLCLQLAAPTGTTVSCLSYISRTNQLAVGYSDGYFSLWNMKTLRRDYHVQIEGGRVPVCAVAFQEPENDPRNCCYLWAVQSSESGGDVSLHLLQLAFSDRKCLASGQIMYELLEYCEERYSLDLSGSTLSLRGQSNNTKLLGCQTIEKFRVHGEREDGVHEVTSPDTSVSVFSWQVNTYGQGKPSVYLGVFDINRWYQAQMPDSLRSGQFLRNCSYFAFWSLEAVVNITTQDIIFDILVHERSLSRGIPPSYPPPEQFYYPSTYNFDATCLLNSGLIHFACTGFQKETLHFLKKSGSSLNEAIPDGYNRCLAAGLLAPKFTDVQASSLSQEEQLQAILAAAVETSSLGLLTSCIKRWTAEEQPRSAANLRFVLEWTWKKVTLTKQEFDRLCFRLFDGSCNFIDPHTLQSLQQCHLYFSNLTAVLNCFIAQAKEVTQQGAVDLTNKQSVTRLLTLYASVVLWFCRSGMLPDSSDETVQLTRPFYNYQVIQQYYSDQRKKLERLARGKWDTSSLMIDGLINQFGDRIQQLWSRDDNGTGKYPPANLHALLDVYLLENADEMSKHAITIYFLLDIMYSFPDKPDSSIESFPTAFSVPGSLIKLIQGFWLLDHNDYQNSVDCILNPASSRVMSWQHSQIIENLLCHGDSRQALRYLQVMKPVATTSKEVKLHMTVLLANRSILEAWNLQRLHSSRLNVEELLKHMYEMCQEMGLIEELLKLTFTDFEQGYLHKFLQTTGVQNQELLLVHHLQRANYISALQLNQSLKTNHLNDCDRRLRERSGARNAILDQYGKILPRVQRTLASERAKPYSLPSLVWREVARPKPLSTTAKQAAPGSIITKANFICNVLSKIKEVSTANEKREEYSPYQSMVSEEPTAPPLQDIDVPDAFFGTPINKSRRVSRLLDSVVHPVLMEPTPLTSSDTDNNQTPHKSPLLKTSSPLHSSLRRIAHMRSFAKASEFSLLETPLVVRKAKALAANTASSGYTSITPQSILRSSVRTTPLVSPSVSPGRSLTPPLRPKETKISFMELSFTRHAKAAHSSEGNLLAISPVLRSSPDAVWSVKGKVASFTQNTPVKKLDEIDASSSGIQEESQDEMEVSKEISNISVRSEQASLEYHDAPTPEDLENDEISGTTNSQPQVNEVHHQMEDGQLTEKPAELALTEMQEEFIADSEEREIEYISAPLNGPNALECMTAVPDIYLEDASQCILETPEGSSVSVTGEQECVSSAKDSESVISIHDSDDAHSNLSENDQDSEEIEENNLRVPTTVTRCEEFDLIETKDLEVELEEADSEKTNYKDIYPDATVQLGFTVESIEQRYTCELADRRETPSETDEIEGEHFEAENNFSLVLEGDVTEEEILEPSSSKTDLELTRPPIAHQKLISENRENIENCETTEKIPANMSPLVDSDHESKTLETLPSEADLSVAEKVLKGTEEKDVPPEVHSEVVLESKLVGNAMMSLDSSESQEVIISQYDNVISIEKLEMTQEKMYGEKTEQINEGQVSPNRDQSTLVKPLTPRRSIRKSSKPADSSTDIIGNITLPTTPKRGLKKAKENVDTLKNSISVVPEEELTLGTRRITRKATLTALDNPEPLQIKEPPSGEDLQVQPSTPTRGRRGKVITSDDLKEPPSGEDLQVQPSTPTRGRRGRVITSDDLREPPPGEDLQVQPSTPTRGRRGRVITSDDIKESPSVEDLQVQPSTPTRGRRGKVITSDDIKEPPSVEYLQVQPSTPTRGHKGKVITSDDIKEPLSGEDLQVQPSTPTRGRKGKVITSDDIKEPLSEEVLQEQPSTPTRGRRGRVITSDGKGYECVEEKNALPLTPTRITRSKNILEPEKGISQIEPEKGISQIEPDKGLSQIEDTGETEHEVVTPRRGRRGKRVVNELVKHFERNSSQPNIKADTSPPVSPKKVSLRWTRTRSENQRINATEEQASKIQEDLSDTPRKRYKKSSNKMGFEETTDTVTEGAIVEDVQESLIISHLGKNPNTSIVRSARKTALPPVTEDHSEQPLLPPESHSKVHSSLAIADEENKTNTRTRSGNKSSVDVSAITFEFSTPKARTKKTAKGSAVPTELIPSTQYAFSPPSTRTRRATRANVSEAVIEPQLQFQESCEIAETEVPEVPASKPRGRPPKHKAKAVTRVLKKPSWSTPPVEIKLISPPESPAVSETNTKTDSTEAKGAEKISVRRTRRRIIAKPVTRRKMR
ncbi:protein ELYS isoform X2 [Xenopus laevis]|uniref:Protein ELYS isoform X2 n=1 Tax=Xenopus laevis TaxID=8355 RepID=A0A8J1KP67_XENLA|nr:protein ELYS isoform X2 [Xenopus laevis]